MLVIFGAKIQIIYRFSNHLNLRAFVDHFWRENSNLLLIWFDLELRVLELGKYAAIADSCLQNASKDRYSFSGAAASTAAAGREGSAEREVKVGAKMHFRCVQLT